MRIFFWFLIIAVATLAINMICLLQMKKHQSIRITPIIAVLCSGYLIAFLLYLLTAAYGPQILEQKLAADFLIEQQSYQTAIDGSHTAYAFCSTEGITFRFSDTALLSHEVPDTPRTVEVYSCRIRTGFSWCYLNETTTICYLLK